jgi:hypothetical protein
VKRPSITRASFCLSYLKCELSFSFFYFREYFRRACISPISSSTRGINLSYLLVSLSLISTYDRLVKGRIPSLMSCLISLMWYLSRLILFSLALTSCCATSSTLSAVLKIRCSLARQLMRCSRFLSSTKKYWIEKDFLLYATDYL